MELKEKLMHIQTELHAPKHLRNTFGNYNYRNAEGILEAVKPLLAKYKCALTVGDDIEFIGDRFYVKAVAVLIDCEGTEFINNVAYAREEDVKKGMDASQVTGSTSSYARKYCLNGLFLLDDTKDADSDEFRNERENRQKKNNKADEKPEDVQSATIDRAKYVALMSKAGMAGVNDEAMKSVAGTDDLKNITVDKWSVLMKKLDATIKAKESK